MLYSPVTYDEKKNRYEEYRFEVSMIVYSTKPEGGVKYLQSQPGLQMEVFNNDHPYRQVWRRYYELDGVENWYPLYLSDVYYRGARMTFMYRMLQNEVVDDIKTYLTVSVGYISSGGEWEPNVTVRRFSLDGTQVDISDALVNTTVTNVFRAMY